MRTDSRNLLDRLDQPDFEYREFHENTERTGGYGWPLLELVSRALGGPRAPAPAVPQASYAPPPGDPPAAAYVSPPVAPAPAPTGHAFFSHYGRPAPVAAEPSPPQDLESLLQSYSVRR